jgi:hypothetical protein
MSRPANPYGNASCESFMKTLKREEIYANKYENLKHLRANIEEFIGQYYNHQRLRSARATDLQKIAIDAHVFQNLQALSCMEGVIGSIPFQYHDLRALLDRLQRR